MLSNISFYHILKKNIVQYALYFEFMIEIVLLKNTLTMLKYLFYVRKIDSTHNVTCVNYLVRDLKHEENMKVLYRDNV